MLSRCIVTTANGVSDQRGLRYVALQLRYVTEAGDSCDFMGTTRQHLHWDHRSAVVYTGLSDRGIGCVYRYDQAGGEFELESAEEDAARRLAELSNRLGVCPECSQPLGEPRYGSGSLADGVFCS